MRNNLQGANIDTLFYRVVGAPRLPYRDSCKNEAKAPCMDWRVEFVGKVDTLFFVSWLADLASHEIWVTKLRGDCRISDRKHLGSLEYTNGQACRG
jgi:hypothetical protein